MKPAPLNDTSEFHDLDAIFPGDAIARRRLVAQVSIRIAAVTIAMVGLYAVLPVPNASGTLAVIGLIAGLVAFMALLALQIRSIVHHQHPVLRAIEVVAFALPLLVFVFAYIYLWISDVSPGAFTEELDRIGAVYYSVSIISTLGFGDISPVTDGPRLVVTLQMLLDIALIAGFGRFVIIATRTGLQRKGSPQ